MHDGFIYREILSTPMKDINIGPTISSVIPTIPTVLIPTMHFNFQFSTPEKFRSNTALLNFGKLSP